MQSSEVLRLILISKNYNKLPSQILNIDDEYAAFCLDEVCSYIQHELEQGKTANWIDKKEEKKDGLQYLLDLQHRL